MATSPVSESRSLSLKTAGDEPEVLGDGHRLVVADSDARRLLTAMLQRVQPEVGEPGDVLAGRVHGEHSAGFLGVLGAIVQERLIANVSVIRSEGLVSLKGVGTRVV